jgi:arylsulfatase A-like enzyme
MIQKGDYKLIVYPTIKKYLLFNMKKDPDEMHNLADNPEYATLLSSMKRDLKELMKQMDDNLDLDNPKPPVTKKRHKKKKITEEQK